MASCSFGVSGLRVINLDLGTCRSKSNKLQPSLYCTRTRKFFRFHGLKLSHSPKNSAIRSSLAEIDSTASVEEEGSERTQSSDAVTRLIPNSSEIESLLTVLCDTTSIAEFELKLGGFRLYVSRNIADQSKPAHDPNHAPVTAHSVVETPSAPNTNGLASSPSLALSKTSLNSTGVVTMLDKAADEGLMILKSPRVGYFRRSKTIKGKKAPPSCKEKDIVKEGQVLCYIEQLGGEIPVESDISGEVVKILRQDGEPVGYGDALIAVLPTFPGIKNLQ